MAIQLTPIALEHAPAVQALASDPRIADTSNVPHPYPPDGAVAWIRYTTAQCELGREMNFAILDDDVLVGVCGVLSIGGKPRSGELGYWIGVPYWGHGFATNAAGQLLRLAFEGRGLVHLRSSCLVRNRASFRVLQKIGFRLVGYGAQQGPKWGPQDQFALFQMTRDDWLRGAGRMPHGQRTP